MTIRELCEQSHALALTKGWYEGKPRQIPELLMLIVSELAEALEEYRDGRAPTDTVIGKNGKPEGFAIEVADAVIRIADMCGYLGIDLADAIETKHAFNRTRPHRHGGKVA